MLTWLYKKFFKRIKRRAQGYVLALVVICVPVLLIATKYLIDLSTTRTDRIGKIEKKCAPECAIAVARKWNSGLSYKQQKEALLRIADGIYNEAPSYSNATLKYSAMPGLEMPIEGKVIKGNGPYDPIKIVPTKSVSLSPALKTVEYEKATDPWCFLFCYTNSYRTQRLLRAFYATFKYERDPAYALEDTVQYSLFRHNEDIDNDGAVQNLLDQSCVRSSVIDRMKSQLEFTNPGGNDQTFADDHGKYSATVTKRVDPDDPSVSIFCEDDKIKVVTDSHKAYAVPASCNVDIVLSIPVNGAANNPNNEDANTLTAGSPISSPMNNLNEETKNTPIYQIGHELSDFVKCYFHYVRGVNIGIIPYSGQCCLNPDRMDNWTVPAEQFNTEYYLSNQNTYPAYIRQGFLYNASKESLSEYDNNTDYGLNSKSMTNIMARQGETETDTVCGNNKLCKGDILSVENPENNATQKFLRVSSHMMKGGTASYANLLTMEYDNFSRYEYWASVNPFFIVELQSDLRRISDLLNMFSPFTWHKNVGINSNFVFIPVTWANNLFQDWTNDPKYDSIDTKNDSENLGRLSVPSKMTEGRKKVLILVVNKPDWFEPGELTYLGFNDDFSEVCAIEGDGIRGDIKYTDTSKRFADGTKFNGGKVMGAKQNLWFVSSAPYVSYNNNSGCYECPDATSEIPCYLSFKQRYLIKIVVEPAGHVSWTKWTCDNVPYYNPIYNTGGVTQVDGEDRILCINSNGDLYNVGGNTGYIVNNQLWNLQNQNCDRYFNRICYGNDMLITVDTLNRAIYSADKGATWAFSSFTFPEETHAIQFHHGIFMIITVSGKAYTSIDGINWERQGTAFTTSSPRCCRLLVCFKGKWICDDGYGNLYSSSDDGANWSFVADGNLQSLTKDKEAQIEWYSGTVANGILYIINTNKRKCYRSHNGQKFEALDYDFDTFARGVVWCKTKDGTNKLVVKSQSDATTGYLGSCDSSIQFTDILDSNNRGTTSQKYAVTDRQEFFIEPSQIRNAIIDGRYRLNFKMKNLRLISAEITNRPYDISKASAEISGATSGSGDIYITTNVKRKMTLDIAQLPQNVTFYGDNGVEENIGTHDIYKPTTFTFSGSNNFKSLANNTKTIWNFTTTGGRNFGHNFSTKKLRYSASGTTITSAVLNNQILRCSGHHYFVSDNVNSKTIVPNTIARPEWNNNYSKGKNSIQYIDPCLYPWRDSGRMQDPSFNHIDDDVNNRNQVGWDWGNYDRNQVAQIVAYDFHVGCYGVQKCKYIATNDWLPASSVRVSCDSGFTVWGKNGWTSVGDIYGTGANWYSVIDCSSVTPISSNEILIFTGRLRYKNWERFQRNEWEMVYYSPYSSQNDCWFISQPYSPLTGNTFRCYWHATGTFSYDGWGVDWWRPASGWTIESTRSDHTRGKDKCMYHMMSTRTATGDKTYRYDGKVLSDTREILETKHASILETAGLRDNCIQVWAVKNANNYCGEIAKEGNKTYAIPQSRNTSIQFGIRNNWKSTSSSSTPYRYLLNSFFILNLEPKSYQGTIGSETADNLKNNVGIYSLPESDGSAWLCFCGDGDLGITFDPDDSKLVYTTADNESITWNIAGNQTITIDPSTHKYEKQTDGTYKIKLNLKNLKVSNLTLLDNSACFTYLPIRPPENAKSINFQTNPYTRNPTGISMNNPLGDRWKYDMETSSYINKTMDGVHMQLYYDNSILGNYFGLFDFNGEGTVMPFIYVPNLSSREETYHRWHYTYTACGLTRVAIPFELNGENYDQNGNPIANDDAYTDTNSKVGATSLLMLMMTLPVNTMLYYGASGYNEHIYRWQSEQNGDLIDTSFGQTQAVKNVTKDACAKLKKDWQDNLRIYLIKYRKQTKYKDRVTGESRDFDYSYLDECASSPSYVYDAKDKEELKQKLDDIASDIKSWAKYTPAKLISTSQQEK